MYFVFDPFVLFRGSQSDHSTGTVYRATTTEVVVVVSGVTLQQTGHQHMHRYNSSAERSPHQSCSPWWGVLHQFELFPKKVHPFWEECQLTCSTSRTILNHLLTLCEIRVVSITVQYTALLAKR